MTHSQMYVAPGRSRREFSPFETDVAADMATSTSSTLRRSGWWLLLGAFLGWFHFSSVVRIPAAGGRFEADMWEILSVPALAPWAGIATAATAATGVLAVLTAYSGSRIPPMLILATGPVALCALAGMALTAHFRLDAGTAHGLYLTITALMIATGAAWAAYRDGDITEPECLGPSNLIVGHGT